PSQASNGDLLLFYRARPDSFVRDLFRVAGPVRQVLARWKRGKDWMAPIRHICTLKAPLHLSQLQKHRVLRSAGFVRGQMRGRFRVSEHWPDLHRMIVATNRTAARPLSGFGPERLT